MLAAVYIAHLLGIVVHGGTYLLTLAAVALAIGLTMNVVLVNIALRPIRALERTARQVWGGDRDARVPNSWLADRATAQVGNTFNLLLDRFAADRVRIQALVAEIIRTGDKERAVVARKLHESIAQNMAALVYQISAARHTSAHTPLNPFSNTAPSASLPPSLTAELDAMHVAATNILQEIRSLAHTVHPRVLDDLGLLAALRTMAHRIQEWNAVKIHIDLIEGTPTDVRAIPPKIVAALYHVVQESVHNALRHARPANITLTLEVFLQNATIRIADDGAGFDLTAATRQNPGIGLFTMQERIALADGELEVTSTPGQGTSVYACVPLPA